MAKLRLWDMELWGHFMPARIRQRTEAWGREKERGVTKIGESDHGAGHDVKFGKKFSDSGTVQGIYAGRI